MLEETRPFALECEVDCETFATPVWPDVPEQFRPLMGDDLSGVPFLDASATASQDKSEMVLFLINRLIDDSLEVNVVLATARSRRRRRRCLGWLPGRAASRAPRRIAGA